LCGKQGVRVLIWNCCNGLGNAKQISQFNQFRADIAILPELKKSNIDALNPDNAIWRTNNHSRPNPKGLGVLGFNGVGLEELPFDEDMELYVPIDVSFGRNRFTLLAIWNFYSACKSGRFKGVKGENCLEWEAMRHYSSLMNSDFLMAGDFNFGPTFSTAAFVRLCNMMNDRGIQSLYHSWNDLGPQDSKHPTFRTPNGTMHHLDHAFGSTSFAERLTGYTVTDFSEVVLSDHAPLLLQFDLPK
jgi:hypothetical protein